MKTTWRTFIQSADSDRKTGIDAKLSVAGRLVRGKRVVLVDDSIVRSNTISTLVKKLREAGAASIHVRIASPPIQHPCHFGIDIHSRDELIAARCRGDVDIIKEAIGADSLGYLSLKNLILAQEISAGQIYRPSMILPVGDPRPSILDFGNPKPNPPPNFCTGCLTGKYPLENP